MAAFDPALVNALVETSNLGILTLTADLQVVMVNPWLLARLAAPPSLPCALTDLFPKLPASIAAALAETLRLRQPRLITSLIQHPIFPLPGIPPEPFMHQSVRLVPLEGEPGLAVLIEDISETTAAEQALRARVVERTQALADSEARQRALINTIGEAIIVTSLDGHITDWNPAAERIYGWQAAEVRGRSITDVFAVQSDDPFESAERSTATARREGIWRGMVVHRRRDGTLIHVASTIAVLHDAGGQPVGMVGVNRDITESKRLGARLNRLERMNRAISRGLTVDAILATLMVEVHDLLPFDQVGLALFTADQMAYHVRAVVNQDQPRLLAGERVALADSLFAVVRTTGEPLILADIREQRLNLEFAEGVCSLMLLPLRIGNEVIGAINFSSHQASTYLPRDAELMIITAEQVAIALNTARLLEDTQRQVRQLTALYEGGLAVSRLLDPAALAQETVRVLRALVEFDYLAVLLIQDSTRALQPFALSEKASETDPDSVQAPRWQVGKSIPGWVADHGQPLRLGDVSQERRYVPVHADVRSELCVPLKVGERVIGVINVETTRLKAYTEEDTRLLLALAGPLAVAIDNARLYSEAQRTEAQMRDLSLRLIRAQEEERSHLAHELHDEVGQTLTILKLNLQSIRAADSPMSPAAAESLTMVAQLLDQIRQLSLNLRPSLLDDLGLAPALRWYLDRAAQHSGLTVRFDHSPNLGRFSTDIETALFRIAQESVTNVLRHAQAQNVWVQLTEREGILELHIADDGIGLDLSPGPTLGVAHSLEADPGPAASPRPDGTRPRSIGPSWGSLPVGLPSASTRAAVGDRGPGISSRADILAPALGIINEDPNRPRAGAQEASPSGQFNQYAGKTLGLSGIAERAALIGAELEIDSVPGKGTNILVRLTIQT